MRYYKMTLTIESLNPDDSEQILSKIDEILAAASDTPNRISIDNKIIMSFETALGGGQSEPEFLFEISKEIWAITKRYVPISLNAMDMDSPVWETYEEGEDTSYFEEASSEYYETKETMFSTPHQ